MSSQFYVDLLLSFITLHCVLECNAKIQTKKKQNDRYSFKPNEPYVTLCLTVDVFFCSCKKKRIKKARELFFISFEYLNKHSGKR